MIAVDVGYGQLVWSLQTDERVTVMDRTNVRTLTLEDIGGEPVDLVVSDLSFISLTLVLPALIGVVKPEGDLVLMVKPQFEVGKERLGKGGVVRDPELRADAVRGVAGQGGRTRLGSRGSGGQPVAWSVRKCRILPVDTPVSVRLSMRRCSRPPSRAVPSEPWAAGHSDRGAVSRRREKGG